MHNIKDIYISFKMLIFLPDITKKHLTNKRSHKVEILCHKTLFSK